MSFTVSILVWSYFALVIYDNITHDNALKGNEWNRKSLQRTIEGLTSVLLSLKKCPMVRYQANSDMTYKLAEAVRVSSYLCDY